MSTFVVALVLNVGFFLIGLKCGKWSAMSDVWYKADMGIHIYRKKKPYKVEAVEEGS